MARTIGAREWLVPVLCAALASTPASADVSPVTSMGTPVMVVPQFQETGAPTFTSPNGSTMFSGSTGSTTSDPTTSDPTSSSGSGSGSVAGLGRSGQHRAAARHGHRDIWVERHLYELDGRFEPCRHLPGSERPGYPGRGSVGGPSGQHPDHRLDQHDVIVRRQQRECLLCRLACRLRFWPPLAY